MQMELRTSKTRQLIRTNIKTIKTLAIIQIPTYLARYHKYEDISSTKM